MKAVILAGDYVKEERKNNKNAIKDNKFFIKIKGKLVGLRLIEEVLKVKEIDKIILIGPISVKKLIKNKKVQYVKQVGKITKNFDYTFNLVKNENEVIYFFCDFIPTKKGIEDFIKSYRITKKNITVGFVEEKFFINGVKPESLEVIRRDRQMGMYDKANCFIIEPKKIKRNRRYYTLLNIVQTIYVLREHKNIFGRLKDSFKLIFEFGKIFRGVDFIKAFYFLPIQNLLSNIYISFNKIRFPYYLYFDTKYIEKKLQDRLKISIGAIFLDEPRLAIDLDYWRDIQILEKYL